MKQKRAIIAVERTTDLTIPFSGANTNFNFNQINIDTTSSVELPLGYVNIPWRCIIPYSSHYVVTLACFSRYFAGISFAGLVDILIRDVSHPNYKQDNYTGFTSIGRIQVGGLTSTTDVASKLITVSQFLLSGTEMTVRGSSFNTFSTNWVIRVPISFSVVQRNSALDV